jgi:small subunit ribosomal protein S6
MAKKSSTPNQYEGMFLFGAGAASEPQATEASVRKFIESHGGNILVLKKWDERKLAYEINGNKRGIYYLSLFTAPPAAITQIERDVKLSEDILRVMILKADHLTVEEIQNHEPQKPEPREERGFGYGGGGFGGGGGYGGDRGDRGGERGGHGGPRGRREEGAPPAPEAAPAGEER